MSRRIKRGVESLDGPGHGAVWIAYAVSLSVFSKELFGVPIFGSVVDVYQIGVAAAGLLLLAVSAKAQWVLAGWAVILGFSFVLLSIYGHSVDVLLKQGLVAAATYAGFAALIQRTTPGNLARAYMNVCFGAAVFGLLQFVLSFGGVSLLMKVPHRLDSLAYEPSHYAIAVAPAAYLSIRALLKTRSLRMFREWTILGSMLCTVSLTAVVVLLVSGIIIGARERGPLLVAVMLGFGFVGYTNQDLLPEELLKRIEAIDAVGDEVSITGVNNLSVFSVISNWEVAVDTLEKGRLFGNGFGGHEGAYLDYHGAAMATLGDRAGFNVIAGHSLFIRVFSEFGILGVLCYVGWFLKGAMEAVDPRRTWWTLSAIYLVGRVFKLGGYFEVGMPIFIVAPFVFYRWNAFADRRFRKIGGKRMRRDESFG